MDSASTAQAQDIVITPPAEAVSQTPPAETPPNPLQTQSTQSTTPQAPTPQTTRFNSFTDLNLNLRNGSGRTAHITMTTVPEDGSWGGISFSVVPFDAGRMCCSSVYPPYTFLTFNCLRRYHGKVDITFIVTQLSGGPTVRETVEFNCT